MRRHSRSMISALALFALVGASGGTCSSGTQAVADVSAQVAKLCTAAGPVISQAQGIATRDATVASLLGYAQSMCTATGAVAGALAPSASADPTTPAWLVGVMTGLSVAAKVAPFVLPLL